VAFQTVARVPTDADDQPLDMLVTDQQVYQFDRQPPRADEPNSAADV
jgi:hypothetical protein